MKVRFALKARTGFMAFLLPLYGVERGRTGIGVRLRNNLVYFLKKILQFVLVIFLLSLIVFYMARLSPGDPLRAYYGESVERMSVEQQEKAREKLGLNGFSMVSGLERLFMVILAYPLSISRMSWESLRVSGQIR